MGNLSCCEASGDVENFKTFCLQHCSPQYKAYLMDIHNIPAHSEDDPSSEATQHIVGNWQQQQVQSGKGIIYRPDLFYYEGDILNAKATGHGTIIWPSHSIYSGSVLDNKANGHGRLTFSDDETSLQGQWQSGLPKSNHPMPLLTDGKKNQITFLNISDRDQQTGSLIHTAQMKSLLVAVQFEDGIKYSGQLKSKQNSYKIEGKGKMTYADGSFYEGDFVEGKMHGNGKYFWTDTGHWYEGEYKMNFKDGFGRYYFDSDNFQEGIWKAGLLELERIEEIQQ